MRALTCTNPSVVLRFRQMLDSYQGVEALINFKDGISADSFKTIQKLINPYQWYIRSRHEYIKYLKDLSGDDKTRYNDELSRYAKVISYCVNFGSPNNLPKRR